MLRSILSGLAVLLAASVGAADADPGAIDEARSALKRFNTTPRYLSEDAQRDALRQDLMSQCDIADALACIEQVLTNPHDSARAAGNNPAYWRAFEAVIDQPALYAAADVSFANRPSDYHVLNLVDAMQAQFLWELGMTEGRIDVERFLERYRHYRRHAAESETLMQRMIFAAAIGIAHYQIELLLPILAARGDFEAIDRIGRALTPFSLEERSLRRTMAGEVRFMLDNISTAERLDREAFPNPELLPLGDLEELRAWVLEAGAAEGERTVAHLGAVSERSWSEFWRYGFDGTQSKLPDEEETMTAFFSDSLRAYANTSRSIEVPIYALQVLVDVYAERTPLGPPQRPAPALWDWEYRTDPDGICLLPTGVQPGLSDFSLEQGACVRYISPRRVYAWLN